MTTDADARIYDPDGDNLSIFAVDQGFCAHASTGKHASVLIDCGVNTASGFRPSSWLDDAGQGFPPIRHLVLSTYAEAYVVDLSGVLQRLGEGTIQVNPSIATMAWRHVLPDLVGGRLANPGPGSQAYALLLRDELPSDGRAPMTLRFFHNGPSEFKDAGNLSLVTLLAANTFRVLFGAAMRTDGWRALLRHSDFRDQVRTVDVFVASSLGRRSGYCSELFEICEPRIIIVPDAASNAPIDPETYAPHASGLRFIDGIYRHVLFTRADGTITVSEASGGRPVVRVGLSPLFARFPRGDDLPEEEHSVTSRHRLRGDTSQ